MNLRPKSYSSSYSIFVLFFLFVSCTASKKIPYLTSLKDSSFQLVSSNFEPLIQNGDILNIGVSALDPEAATIFNLANSVGFVMGQPNIQNATLPGFVVDINGFVTLPKLGMVKATGKTKSNFTKELTEKLKPFYKDPVVNIRYMNYRVTVLGEVARPATLFSQNERMTIFEALGQCGDLTIFGKRDNVLLLRQEDGKQISKRLNLNDISIMNSDYYFLKSNDVIYVEPNKARIFAGTEVQAMLPLILSTLSFVIILFNTF